MIHRRIAAAAVLAAHLFCAPAFALELSVAEPAPTAVGASTRFEAKVTDVSGAVEIRWTFGDGEATEFTEGATAVTHTYAAPGHYSVIVVARDDSGFQSRSFVHTVHTQPTARPPQSASPLAYLPERNYVVTANTDNDTVTVVDAGALETVAEIPVFDEPVAVALAPDGKLWVVHRADYAVAIVDLDTLKVTGFFRLPYASQPMGIVFGASGDAYAALMATGEVARLDAATGELRERRFVAPWLRGISLSGDQEHLWLTRFVSPEGRGEVYQVDAATLDVVARVDLLEDTTTEDSSVQGRGLPNYLFSVAISPDGKEAWVPGKKDNMARGLQRDGLPLTQDNTVRPLIAILDLDAREELPEWRIDLDDRNLPRHVSFSPLGDYAFVSIYGSDMVEVWDSHTKNLVTGMRGSKGPVATILGPEERLFVLGDSSRDLLVYDVSGVLSGADHTTRLVGEIDLVANEKLSAEVLYGKQLFGNADDPRMAREGYLSCASCHVDGLDDGRVWDFFDRGEGFRNTTALVGRRGMGHGRVHWSGNFDEIQDFEGDIRHAQGGLGFMTNEDYESGTRSSSLGDPKAGLSPELDAIAAYVASLETIPRSPYRNPDGTLTDDAVAGREIFLRLGCDSCHAGDDFTDSAEGLLHDVGTLTPLSGSRLGDELPGIDTPTLLGVWQTAPYLHDGSAPTLRDVLTTRNPEGKHGDTSDLTEEELDQLVAYLLQIDQGLPPTELVLPSDPGGAGGAGGADGAPSDDPDPSDPGDPGAHPDGNSASAAGCGCDLARSSGPARSGAGWWCALLLLGGLARRSAARARAETGRAL